MAYAPPRPEIVDINILDHTAFAKEGDSDTYAQVEVINNTNEALDIGMGLHYKPVGGSVYIATYGNSMLWLKFEAHERKVVTLTTERTKASQIWYMPVTNADMIAAVYIEGYGAVDWDFYTITGEAGGSPEPPEPEPILPPEPEPPEPEPPEPEPYVPPEEPPEEPINKNMIMIVAAIIILIILYLVFKK